MRIQLIFTPAIKKPIGGQLSEGIWPPMGVLYLAAYIRQKLPKTELRITDGLLRGFKGTIKEILDFNPDILCVSYSTLVATDAYIFINKIKELRPNIFILTGGPHATAFPKESLEASKADINVIGEGEETVIDIIKKKKDWKSIEGIAYRNKKNQVKITPIRRYILNLDELPIPAWDLINRKEYRGWFLFKQTPEAAIFMSRGCPFNCTYCSNKVWKCSSPKLRLRSPKSVADELEYLNKQFAYKEFFDNSDEFNNHLQNAINICKEIRKRKLKVTWKTQMRAAPITDELVWNMKKAGCWYVHL